MSPLREGRDERYWTGSRESVEKTCRRASCDWCFVKARARGLPSRGASRTCVFGVCFARWRRHRDDAATKAHDGQSTQTSPMLLERAVVAVDGGSKRHLKLPRREQLHCSLTHSLTHSIMQACKSAPRR